jgi:hypothetical protein
MAELIRALAMDSEADREKAGEEIADVGTGHGYHVPGSDT